MIKTFSQNDERFSLDFIKTDANLNEEHKNPVLDSSGSMTANRTEKENILMLTTIEFLLRQNRFQKTYRKISVR